MMDTYPKINSIYKRHMDGHKKGKLILGQYSDPVFEYLAKNPWEFTEKVDGTNIRIGARGDHHGGVQVEFAGRSDNAIIPKGLLEYLHETFTSTLFEKADLNNLVLFGEGYGDKIQSGGKYFDEVRDFGKSFVGFVLFDVKIDDWWLNREDVDDVAAKLGIESVPTIGVGTLHDAVDIVTDGITFNESGAVVRWGRNGLQSQWGNFEAEGIVARPVVPLQNRRGERVICKIKGKDFK